uniref:Uncharacterized protein n=1 Tax=Panagrolaimus superbus TaxID=310955 RepID=A0A914XZX0_9BILA
MGKIIKQTVPKGNGWRYETSCTRLKLILSAVLDIVNWASTVRRYEKELNVKEFQSDDEINSRLELWTTTLMSKALTQQFDSKGYRDDWMLKVKDVTVYDAFTHLRYYICYIIASNEFVDGSPETEIVDDVNYHIEKFDEYEHHLKTSTGRIGDYMAAISSFQQGKKTATSDFDPDEFKSIKAVSIVGYRINVAAALKLTNILPLRMGVFNSTQKRAKEFRQNLERLRVSRYRDLWPLMLLDVLEYFEKRRLHLLVISKVN